jgi:hypothetical protein
MGEDDEIKAMSSVAAALTPLDDDARNRVLQWAASRYGGRAQALALGALSLPGAGGLPPGNTSEFETFAELFEAARPSTEREKGLVAAYWTQICQSQSSFASQSLNDALKDLGHGVGNITDALTALKEERPALLLQLKKSGSSKQARKTYKLTQEGVRRVHAMIAGEAPSVGE